MVEMRICSKCGISKPLTSEYFFRCKACKGGHRTDCKSCKKKYDDVYKAENCEKLRSQRKVYYHNNRERQKEKWKEWRSRDDNAQRCRDNSKKWREDNIERAREYDRVYAVENKERKRQYRQKRQVEEAEYLKEYRKNWRLKKLKEDPLTIVRERARNSIKTSVRNRGFKKDSVTSDYLGCEYNEFRIHIESLFEEGMSWDNHTEWEIDHIYPISWCNTKEEVFIYSHYSNLQPMWKHENRLKKDRFIGKKEPLW